MLFRSVLGESVGVSALLQAPPEGLTEDPAAAPLLLWGRWASEVQGSGHVAFVSVCICVCVSGGGNLDQSGSDNGLAVSSANDKALFSHPLLPL